MISSLAVAGQALGSTTAAVTLTLARTVGVAAFAGLISGTVALAYRWYVRERVPTGLALLAGLAAVAVSLSTTSLLANELAPDGPDIELVTALVHVAAFLTSGFVAYAGTRFGDRFGVDLFAAAGVGDVDADVSEIVQTVGRVTSVQLPDEIEDIVGYDPVTETTKETLAGRRFLFPRRLTRDELRERLVSRLRTDYGVGHVDVEFGDGGAVEFLAVGSRAAGIGPTLPPATNAVAIRADPAHAASAGDLVQVWETDPMRRVLTGELRGVAGDVVTVAIDAADTPKLNPTDRYKLVTLPVQDRPDREFASLLRAADETLATITVEGDSALDGVALDSLDVTVAAITRTDEPPEPLPASGRTLQAGDVVYVIATPEILRKIENAAQGPEESVAPADTNIEPADPNPEPTDPKSASMGGERRGPDSDPVSTSSDPGPADLDSGSAKQATSSRDGGVPDQVSTGGTDGDGADADGPLSGDAFADVDELPGIDQDVETPTVSDEPPDDADDDAAANGRDAAPEPTESAGDDSVADPVSDNAVDEGVVPFTPLDVGDDDPLADPLTEPNEDADGDGEFAPEDDTDERLDEGLIEGGSDPGDDGVDADHRDGEREN